MQRMINVGLDSRQQAAPGEIQYMSRGRHHAKFCPDVSRYNLSGTSTLIQG